MLEQLRVKFRTKEINIKKFHWNFLPLWVVANASSYAIGGKISAFITSYYISGNIGILLSFAVMSMAIALAQWLVIRPYIFGMGWLWTTLMGGTLGGVLSSWASFQLAVTYGDAADFLTIYGCLRGLTIGLAQWTTLRPYSPLAEWWIVGTTTSWYISVQIGAFLLDKHLGYFLTTVVGAIYGLLTGLILLSLFWLRRRSR